MKETVFLIMGVLLSLSCAVSGRFFLRAGRREEYGKAFLLKGLTGLCFVVLGALNFVLCTDRIFGVRVLCGLCLGLLGDQLLALRFVYREKHDQFFSLGAAVFAVGHGLYLAALFGHDKGVLPAALPFWRRGFWPPGCISAPKRRMPAIFSSRRACISRWWCLWVRWPAARRSEASV